MLRRSSVPLHTLRDCRPAEVAQRGIFVGRVEDSLERCPQKAACHRHDHFEFFWVTGEGSHFNDFRRHALRGRSLVIVSPGQVHAWPDAAGLRGIMVGFTEAFFDGREPPPSGLLGYPFVFDGGAPPVLPVAEDDPAASALDCVTAQIEREFAAQADGWLAVLRDYLRIAFTWAARLHAAAMPEPTEKAARAPVLVRRFRLRLEEKFRETGSVGNHARALGVTSGHLNDTLRAWTGRSAGDLVRARVLLEARRLLLHSPLSVSEIAYGLGFKDPSYFARAFRRETGVSPGEFRLDIRENYRTNPAESPTSRLRWEHARAS
ncbi:AraC family transcriptional regulator [Termitidicoccus mucosus]|uniref:AraC family transcriptional regulator n=2 Tax=Termitidicoccus mucosus TaxID=1184151 RepID=A0A178IJJ5_9BACT|nr:AraC family transcriptional regulator [Opitutaceae bacterium TSB47]